MEGGGWRVEGGGLRVQGPSFRGGVGTRRNPLSLYGIDYGRERPDDVVHGRPPVREAFLHDHTHLHRALGTLIEVSMYDQYSIGPCIRSICTR